MDGMNSLGVCECVKPVLGGGPGAARGLDRATGSARGDTGIRDGVVLVTVDAGGLSILLAGDSVAILGGEVSAVGGAVGAFFGVDGVLTGFEIFFAPRGDLAGADALVDASLLVMATVVDSVALMIVGLGEEAGCGEGEKGGER